MSKMKQRSPVIYYTEYGKDILLEKIEGLINPFNTIQVIRRFIGK